MGCAVYLHVYESRRRRRTMEDTCLACFVFAIPANTMYECDLIL